MEVEIVSLFQKYMDGNCSPQELEQVLLITRQGKYLAEWEVALSTDSAKVINSGQQMGSFDELKASALNERILNSINDKSAFAPIPMYKKLWARITVAASILLIASIGLYFYSIKQSWLVQGELVYQQDVAPGKNGATLTLANGQQILINDALVGNIAEQSGVRISKTADGQLVYEVLDNGSGKLAYNTLSTSRGEQTQVRLPDGTLAFLNAESSLRYPASFAKQGIREVTLSGEGYFEVAKDKAHPFVVLTDGQRVEVLGTHFNINSYKDEKAVRTTLLEGAVKVNDQVLKPNQQSVLLGGKIRIGEVDVEQVVAWKNGSFLFEDEPLSSIMRKIERWYDVEVVYEDAVDQNKLYWGGVSRYDKVSKVLEKLTLTGNIHFKIEGRRIVVTK